MHRFHIFIGASHLPVGVTGRCFPGTMRRNYVTLYSSPALIKPSFPTSCQSVDSVFNSVSSLRQLLSLDVRKRRKRSLCLRSYATFGEEISTSREKYAISAEPQLTRTPFLWRDIVKRPVSSTSTPPNNSVSASPPRTHEESLSSSSSSSSGRLTPSDWVTIPNILSKSQLQSLGAAFHRFFPDFSINRDIRGVELAAERLDGKCVESSSSRDWEYVFKEGSVGRCGGNLIERCFLAGATLRRSYFSVGNNFSLGNNLMVGRSIAWPNAYRSSSHAYPRNIPESDGLFRRIFDLFSTPPKGFEGFFPPADDRDSSRGDDKDDKKKTPKNDRRKVPLDSKQLALLAMVLGGMFVYSLDGYPTESGKEITFKDFINDYLSKGLVEKVQVVNGEFCRVVLRDEGAMGKVYFRVGSAESFERRLEQCQAAMEIHPKDFIPVQYVKESSIFREIRSFIPYAIAFVAVITILQLMSGWMTGGDPMDRISRMMKANPAVTKEIKSKVRFKDVAGLKEAKLEISEFVDILKNPAKYAHIGARLPKGALLCGPPGAGKTLLAKAVAGEANVPFFSTSGSDFVEVFVGVGSSRVRDLFAQARKSAPSIIFIDEIDAIGQKRGGGGFAGGAASERENTLNQILVEMDGFTTTSGVIVMAGTNRADILDPALTRPGRFDRIINIDKPDLTEREAIFQIHLKPLKLDPSISINELSRRLATLSPGLTGADIANVCNEGAMQAARRGGFDGVNYKDFDKATDRILAGVPRSQTILSQVQKNIVAYHETGHALVGWLLKYADPVLKVSILPRSRKMLGFAQSLPDESMLFSKEALLDRIAVILGGRAAEELFIGSISTGAVDDLDKVTKMSYAFVTQWGMNDQLGLVSYQNTDNEQRIYKPYSEVTAQLIDKEVKDLIDSQYYRVKNLLWSKAEAVHKLSSLLFNYETISYGDLVECVGARPFPMKEEYKSFLEGTDAKTLPPAQASMIASNRRALLPNLEKDEPKEFPRKLPSNDLGAEGESEEFIDVKASNFGGEGGVVRAPPQLYKDNKEDRIVSVTPKLGFVL